MKALELLKNHICDLEKMILVFDEYAMYKSSDETKKAIQELTQAIEELEDLQKEKDLLEEYVQFARLHIETYRCSCGSLGRIGYRCSNKECNKY